MSNQEQVKNVFPMEELTKYHQELTEKYKNTATNGTTLTPEIKDLISFNGYYSMGNDTGAFFTIDTNMHVKTSNTGISSPLYDVSFIISMNGKSAVRVLFTGTFQKTSDGYHLVQKAAGVGGMSELDLDLTFSRQGLTNGTTGKLTGSITIAALGQSAVSVIGFTYNNPIPYSRYQGHYQTKSSTSATAYPVAHLDEGFTLKYNFDTEESGNKGELTRVPTYTYNLNMYYFSFTQAGISSSPTSSLIMGTSPSAGLVSNNMTILELGNDAIPISTRSIQTITNHNTKSTSNISNVHSKGLTAFSGYYPIAAVKNQTGIASPIVEGAFIAIEGDYTTVGSSSSTTYSVKIGISVDGVTTDTYNFDETMLFSNDSHELTIPNPNTAEPPILQIAFTPEYIKLETGEKISGSLVSMSGSILGCSLKGDNALNPVPLSAFKETKMTKHNSEKQNTTDGITVNSDYEITINGNTITYFTYVPLMYILAASSTLIEGPDTQTVETILSLGTNAVQGNTCITTVQNYVNKKKVGIPDIYFVSALPPQAKADGESSETKKVELA